MFVFDSHVQERIKAIAAGKGLDWATAEALAFGSLMVEGHGIRYAGNMHRSVPPTARS